MTDSDIYRKALARYRAVTHQNTVFNEDVIIFLEKEIDRYREKIESSDSGKDDTVHTEERTRNSGTMTINYSGCYQDLAGILLANGYFVCCHVNKSDKKDDETITIEFWKE